jgi:hypothetical protein
MDRLPQHAVNRIVDHLARFKRKRRLSSFATLSRRWKYAVERHLFSSLTVNFGDMPMLESFLSDRRRRCHLRHLKYRMVIQPVDSQAEQKRGFSENQVYHYWAAFELKCLWAFLRLYWVRRSPSRRVCVTCLASFR